MSRASRYEFSVHDLNDVGTIGPENPYRPRRADAGRTDFQDDSS
jgi:hypothetical protein